MYFVEAFKALDCLTEDAFSTKPEDLQAMKKMLDDDVVDEIDIYDTTATAEDDLSDSYVGKVILDCCTCHSLFYRDPVEVVIDEEQDAVDVDKECPICASIGGYKIIGEVAPFKGNTEQEVEATESLHEGIKDIFKKKKTPSHAVVTLQDGTKDKWYTIAVGSDKKELENFIVDAMENGAIKRAKVVTFEDAKKLTGERNPAAKCHNLDEGLFDKVKKDDRLVLMADDAANGGNNWQAQYHSKSEDSLKKVQKVLQDMDKKLDRDVEYKIVTAKEAMKLDSSAKRLVLNDSAMDADSALPELKKDAYGKVEEGLFDKVKKDDRLVLMADDASNGGNVWQAQYHSKSEASLKKVQKVLEDIAKKLDTDVKYKIVTAKEAMKLDSSAKRLVLNDPAMDADTALPELKQDAYGNVNEGLFGIKTKKEKAAEKARKEQEAEDEKDAIEAEERRERVKKQLAADSWGTHDRAKREAERENSKSNSRSTKGGKPSNTAKAGISYSGGDYYNESKSVSRSKDDLNESAKDVDAIIAKIKSYTKGFGSFRANDKGVRFVTLEDDLAEYVSRDKFDEYILKTHDHNSDIDDILDDIPWEDVIYCRYASDIPEYRDDKKVLNHKYGFSRASRTQVNESIKDLSITTDDTKLEMTSDEDGKVTVTSEPVAAEDTDDEMIAPVSDETEEIIDTENSEEVTQEEEGSEETEGDEDTVDLEMSDFVEESFDRLGQSLFCESYANVKSFKTLSVKESGNKLFIEGVLGFASGKKGKTTFIFEGVSATKSGKVLFKGYNRELKESCGSLELRGHVSNRGLVTESLVRK